VGSSGTTGSNFGHDRFLSTVEFLVLGRIGNAQDRVAGQCPRPFLRPEQLSVLHCCQCWVSRPSGDARHSDRFRGAHQPG
jgi:hypothetical protein